MKKNLLKFNDVPMLTRAQMKNIRGGAAAAGTRCVYYCCPSSCSTPFLVLTGNCASHDACQDMMTDNPCGSGDYVAALCKG